MSTTSTTLRFKGLLSFAVGLLTCFIIGVPFLFNLFMTCFAFITIEQGLHLLELPTISQLIQKLIHLFYRS